MLINRFQILIPICHRCKEYSQTQRAGGCAGPCPCHWDGRDIIEHAQSGYCPAGRYPFAGLGSVIGWVIWKLRIPHVLRWLKLFNPQTCECALRQKRLNNIFHRIWRRVRGDRGTH